MREEIPPGGINIKEMNRTTEWPILPDIKLQESNESTKQHQRDISTVWKSVHQIFTKIKPGCTGHDFWTQRRETVSDIDADSHLRFQNSKLSCLKPIQISFLGCLLCTYIYIYRHRRMTQSGFCFCLLCQKQISCRIWWMKELEKWTILVFSYLEQMIYCWLQSVEISAWLTFAVNSENLPWCSSAGVTSPFRAKSTCYHSVPTDTGLWHQGDTSLIKLSEIFQRSS